MQSSYWRHPRKQPVMNFKYFQACKTTEDRTKRLLYTLKLRGCDALRKLRHVLHITGHNFLADHLYEEGTL